MTVLTPSPEQLAEPVLPALYLITTPSAGANWAVEVPGEYLWEPLSIHYRFTTDATVANRFLNLEMDDGINRYWVASAPNAHTASLQGNYCWAAEMGAFSGTATVGVINGPLPRVLLPPGHRIKTSTGNFFAGDAYSNIRILVRQYSTRPGPAFGASIVEPIEADALR